MRGRRSTATAYEWLDRPTAVSRPTREEDGVLKDAATEIPERRRLRERREARGRTAANTDPGETERAAHVLTLPRVASSVNGMRPFHVDVDAVFVGVRHHLASDVPGGAAEIFPDSGGRCPIGRDAHSCQR